MMADKTFLIVNRRSGKALQATGLDNGLVVEQSEITSMDPQLWRLKETENGTVIVNKAAAKVLDVMKNGTENGAWTQLWEEVGGESQFWTVSAASRGYKKITHRMSGKVLDIQDISDENGAAAQIWEDVGGANQEWKLVDYPKAEAKKTARTVEKKAKKEPAAKPAVKAKTETKAAEKKPAKAKTVKAAPARLKDDDAPKAATKTAAKTEK